MDLIRKYQEDKTEYDQAKKDLAKFMAKDYNVSDSAVSGTANRTKKDDSSSDDYSQSMTVTASGAADQVDFVKKLTEKYLNK